MCIDCLKDKPIFEQILTEHIFWILNDVVTILFNTASPSCHFFWRRVETIYFFEYFCSLISKCQNPCLTMCDIIEQWLQIESIVARNNNMTEIYKEICIVPSPILLVANSLHPVYKGLTFEHNPERNVRILEYFLTILDDQKLYDFYEYSKNLFWLFYFSPHITSRDCATH